MASNRVKLSTEFNSALSRASAPRRPRQTLITVVWAPGPGVRSVTWENYESWSWMTANNGNRQPRLSSELALWLRESERAAILLRTFNYLAQSHIRNRNVYLHKTENNVNHVSFVCLRISTIFAKKCPKKLSMIMRYIFGQHQHGQFGNITHPPRHCYWGTRVASVTCLFLSRHVSWQCRGKSHFNNMILSGNLCVVVSGWHWTVLCMMLCVVVFIGQ